MIQVTATKSWSDIRAIIMIIIIVIVIQYTVWCDPSFCNVCAVMILHKGHLHLCDGLNVHGTSVTLITYIDDSE